MRDDYADAFNKGMPDTKKYPRADQRTCAERENAVFTNRCSLVYTDTEASLDKIPSLKGDKMVQFFEMLKRHNDQHLKTDDYAETVVNDAVQNAGLAYTNLIDNFNKFKKVLNECLEVQKELYHLQKKFTNFWKQRLFLNGPDKGSLSENELDCLEEVNSYAI